MKISRLLTYVLTFVSIILLYTGNMANTYAADGAALFKSKGCTTCHGADAKTTLQPSYPKLAGQNADYLAQQIMDIRDGKRTNGKTALMKPMVANLTDEEIKAIADWLTTLD